MQEKPWRNRSTKRTHSNQRKLSEAKRRASSPVSEKKMRKKKKNSEILIVNVQEQQIVQTYKDWLKSSKTLRQELENYIKESPSKNQKTTILLQEMSTGIHVSTKATQRIIKKIERTGYIEPTTRTGSFNKEGSIKKSRIETFLFYAFLLFVVICLSSVLNMQSESGIPKNIAGYAPMTVLTRSMQRIYPQHSFVVTKVTDPDTLEIGDDITYIKENNTTVTHRIIGINESYMETGARGFETKGVENPRKDEEVVRAENVIGKVVFSNYLIGRVLLFVQENMVLTAGIGIGMIYLIDLLIKHIALAIKGKGELR